ncbi:glycerate kinase family protein [Bacteroides clarus]|uniref:glycerate kinase family protein n=1 Tax=Bacteroides clarus TaxID=626929 RepID=UPI003FEFD778
MKKAVLAIDSFKGCLTSAEAEAAAAEGVHAALPECEVIRIPVADGGEGMLDVLIAATHGKSISVQAHGPLMELREARYGISGDGQTAFIEMAAISGLPLVAPEKRNPMQTTTFGTGELIRDALQRGCRHFIIGLGGSATNDAGLGMLRALGFRFPDKTGNVSGYGGQMMGKVDSIDTSSVHPLLSGCTFTAACDVRNPFYGTNGAAYVFAPQKGADAAMIEALDAGMRHLAAVIFRTTGKDISSCPGAGAAGGMGGSLSAFLNAELKPGIQLLLEMQNFAEQIKDADLIITGEGKSDRQTVMGKVPYGILTEARKQHIPVVLIAGGIEDTDILTRAGFHGIFSITPSPVVLEQAMQPEFARMNIRRTVEQICRIIR